MGWCVCVCMCRNFVHPVFPPDGLKMYALRMAFIKFVSQNCLLIESRYKADMLNSKLTLNLTCKRVHTHKHNLKIFSLTIFTLIHTAVCAMLTIDSSMHINVTLHKFAGLY